MSRVTMRRVMRIDHHPADPECCNMVDRVFDQRPVENGHHRFRAIFGERTQTSAETGPEQKSLAKWHGARLKSSHQGVNRCHATERIHMQQSPVARAQRPLEMVCLGDWSEEFTRANLTPADAHDRMHGEDAPA